MKEEEHEAAGKTTTYQPTERERAVIRGYLDRVASGNPAPRVKVVNDGKAIEFDHPNQAVGHGLLAEALGTIDTDFISGLLSQLVNAGSQGREISPEGINFMLAVIKGLEPKDQLEAMLAAQMAAIHMATMTFARRLAHVEDIPQQDSAERALNKLARTYTTQMEALKRYRTGGEQKVTVQHVSVGEGGQAIVGNVTQAGPQAGPQTAADKPAADKTLALTEGRQSPMPIIDEPKRARVLVRRGQKSDGRSSA